MIVPADKFTPEYVFRVLIALVVPDIVVLPAVVSNDIESVVPAVWPAAPLPHFCGGYADLRSGRPAPALF